MSNDKKKNDLQDVSIETNSESNANDDIEAIISINLSS